ncbi:MAG: type II toxin-antitoxin system VapC family toxin [Chloroflexota bacterium]
MPRFVVDSTIATKWYLDDELYVEEASHVLSDFRLGRIRLLAPRQLAHEVASALLFATRHPTRPRRITLATGRSALDDFLQWQIDYIHHEQLTPSAYDLAGRLNCSYYDALYLSLAEMTNSQFVHADERLARTLGDRFPLALWIGRYSPTSP